MKLQAPALPHLIAGILLSSILIACGGSGSSRSVGGSSGSASGSGSSSSSEGPLGCSLDLIDPNYLAETDPSTHTENSVHWWDHFPLKVFFKNDQVIQSKQLSTVAFSGLDAWSATAGKSVVQTTTSESSADVVITFNKLSSPPGSGGQLAVAYFSFNRTTKEIISGKITLNVWDSMTLDEVQKGLRFTAQHEFGHILFLNGHSSAGADTMYPYAPTNVYFPLTSRDENSFASAYCNSFEDRTFSSRAPDDIVEVVIID